MNTLKTLFGASAIAAATAATTVYANENRTNHTDLIKESCARSSLETIGDFTVCVDALSVASKDISEIMQDPRISPIVDALNQISNTCIAASNAFEEAMNDLFKRLEEYDNQTAINLAPLLAIEIDKFSGAMKEEKLCVDEIDRSLDTLGITIHSDAYENYSTDLSTAIEALTPNP